MAGARAALIVGLHGLELRADERAFLADVRPAGIILFARNITMPEQVGRLIAEARAAIGCDDSLALIDQEGGRVQRLRPPHWRALPRAATLAALYQRDREAGCAAARLIARLTAGDLAALGIDTNCTPVLDLPVDGAHDIIGDRAFGTSVDQVVALGRAVAEGHLAGGVLPVIKHIPGHGRARADSHLELPVVATRRDELARTDFAPFAALADLPVAMTAHIVFSAIDPLHPASTSAVVTSEVIRGAIGFDGLLMSDDLSMKALGGPMRTRAEAVIGAGSDLALHCNGDLAEMQAAAAGVPALAGRAAERFVRACALRRRNDVYDPAAAEAMLDDVLSAGT
jgi:beta-N-acetylhexosaminidase